MNFTTENFLLIGSLLLFISLIAGKTSFRLGVPTLIFFLFVGMLAGTSFSGLVVFNDAITAQFIGVVALNFILFAVFFITITSVLIQGTSLIRVAKWLRVLLPQRVKQITPVDVMLRENISTEMVEVDIPDDSCVVGKRIVDLIFPEKSLIVLIQRNDRYISPTGSTVIEPNDKLIIVAEDKTSLRESFSCLSLDANTYQR